MCSISFRNLSLIFVLSFLLPACSLINFSSSDRSEQLFSLSKLNSRAINITQAALYYKGELAWPTNQRKINSRFGWRGRRRFHFGIDVKGKEGDQIYAAHPGKVVYSDYHRGFGNLIIIQNGSLITLYAHNDRNFVEAGEDVTSNQLIGTIGSTGNASGSHLHFEVRVRGAGNYYLAADPIKFF